MAESAFYAGDIEGQIKGLTDQIGTLSTTVNNKLGTHLIYRGAEVATAKNGATLDTNNSYTRALKGCGNVIVEIRITCPTITTDGTLIATLTSALCPFADIMYLKAYDMWGTTINGIVSIRSNGNIEAMTNCSGKNIQIVASYPVQM